MVASRALDGHARPALHGIWHASQVPSTDLVTHEARRALNQHDNCVTSDQNFAESMFFHTHSKSEAGLTDHCLFNLAIRSIVDKVE